MRDAGFHSHRAAKKGDGLAPSQSIDPHVPTGFEDRILLKLANRGRGVLGLRSALAGPGMSGCVQGESPMMRRELASRRRSRLGPKTRLCAKGSRRGKHDLLVTPWRTP